MSEVRRIELDDGTISTVEVFLAAPQTVILYRRVKAGKETIEATSIVMTRRELEAVLRFIGP